MTLITIRETGAADESPNATVSFDNRGENSITITDPFSEQEEQRLEWYFEEHLRFPFLEGVRAEEAKRSVASYGEVLFDQVFQDRSIYSRYSQARQEGVEKLRFEIVGSPEFFHRLHWETLKDPELPTPFVVEAPMVRRTFHAPIIDAKSKLSPTINLLIVTARPDERRDVGYRTITRPLVESLRQASLKVRVDIVRPGTYEALTKHLDSVRDDHGAGFYHIVHFDLHGGLLTYEQLQKGSEAESLLYQTRYGRGDIEPYEGRKAFLSFEGEEAGKSDLAEAGEIAELLINHRIPIAVLNACQSGKQVADSESSLASRFLEAGIQTVLAMGYSVTVSAAALMMETLYRQFFAEEDLPVAIRRARKELFNQKGRMAYFNQQIDLEDWMLPVVYQSGGATAESPIALREFNTDEEVEFYEHQARRYVAPEPTYGFVGRDLDILRIENRLLSERDGKPSNLLLIKGMGGSGKTTLLNHLMEWWQTTNFVGEVFYFGYDKKAWTLQQIMDQIAKVLFEAEGKSQAVADTKLAAFRAMNLGAQQQKLAALLRTKRHLLVLDNLESVTGSNLAIMNTLTEEERLALREFLLKLSGGKTFVLLGTRGGEGWLIEGQNAPLRTKDVYDLPGLDPEAASTLAERILERNVPDRKMREECRNSSEFRRLLEVLDGYPLPMQVVLANLARQSPAEVLKALQAGGALEDSEIKSKTESIMRCIDYSHSNLSPEAQELLLCLTPFTGVIYEGLIEEYTKHLKGQPNLGHIRFDLWPDVLEEAKMWGLLTPDQIPGYLRLQPVFPYFLRTRLNELEEEMRKAIEITFRELYNGASKELAILLQSKEPKERQMGQALTCKEYENLNTALDLALRSQASICNLHYALSLYLDSVHDQKRGLELGEKVLAGLESYSSKALAGQIGVELVGAIDDIAKHQLLLSRYPEARESYQKSSNLLEKLDHVDDQLRARLKAINYHNLGIVAQEQREWVQADDYCQKALEIEIELKDRYSQANTYNQLGRLAQKQRELEQAEEYYKQALEIYIELKDRYAQAGAYHLLGMVSQEQQEWVQADDYYQKALEIKIEFNDRYSQASTYHQLGRLAEVQRKWEQAEKYYKQALEIEIEFNDRYSQASNYHQLGLLAQRRRELGQAREYLLKALEISVEFDDKYSTIVALCNLNRLWQASYDDAIHKAVASILGVSEEVAKSLLEGAAADSDK
ncbi:MAG TPA: tetratricopeptide repeat protein [Methanothrix sp.]|nr:tetratricopeptide repeat protein [Methanothrix sp.]